MSTWEVQNSLGDELFLPARGKSSCALRDERVPGEVLGRPGNA